MITSIASALGLKELFVKIGLGVLTLLVIGFVIWRAVAWYDGKIEAAFNDGEKAAYAAVELKTVTTNSKLDGAAVVIREETNAKNTSVDAVVRTVLVRGPGKASSCPSVANAEAGGYDGAAAGPQDAMAPVHNRAGSELITLPFAAIVGIIGDHDKLLNIEAGRRKNDQVSAEIIAAEGE